MGKKKRTLGLKPLDLVRQSIVGGARSSLGYIWRNNNGIWRDDERTAQRVSIRHWRARDPDEKYQLGRSPNLSGWAGCLYFLFLFTLLQSMQGEASETLSIGSDAIARQARQETRFLLQSACPSRERRAKLPWRGLALKLSSAVGKERATGQSYYFDLKP